MQNGKFYYWCSDCQKKITAPTATYLCPDCAPKNEPGKPLSGILKVYYSYDRIRQAYPHDLLPRLVRRQYADILPVDGLPEPSFLRVGDTPLYTCRLAPERRVWVKDETKNPTLSLEDRATTLICAYAAEKGIDTIVTSSGGDEAISLAGICASTGQKAVIMAPQDTPRSKLVQMIAYGAKVIPLKANREETFALSVAAGEKFGWLNRDTAYNPFTIEGKKTAALEIYARLGQRPPDWLYLPVGDGVTAAAIYKGFEDLVKLGLTERVPRIVGIQPQQCAPAVNQANGQAFASQSCNTIAQSLRIPVPRNMHMALDYFNQYKGLLLTVDDNEIIAARQTLARQCGVFASWGGAAAVAGYLRHRQETHPAAKAVVLITGSGLQDIASGADGMELPEVIEPTLEMVEKSCSKLLGTPRTPVINNPDSYNDYRDYR